MNKAIAVLLFFTSTLLFSQSKIDSLEVEYKNARSDSVKIRILHELFKVYKSSSKEKAVSKILESIALARESQDHALLAKGYNKYGEFLRSQSLNDSAVNIFEISIDLSEKYSLQPELADATMGLGYCYLRRGDYENALVYHEKSLKISTDNTYDLGMARSYSAIGDVYSQMREYSKGMDNYIKSAEKSKTLDDLNVYGITLSNIGMLFIKMENYKNAKTYLVESDSIFKMLKNENGRAYVQYTLGQIYMETGPYDKAVTYTKNALATYEKMGRKNEAGHVLYNLGTIYWRQNKFKESLAAFEKKLDISILMKDSVSISSTYKAIGDCYVKLDDYKKAKEQYFIALDVANLIKNDRRKLDIYAALSDIYALEKDYKNAFENERNYGVTKNIITAKEKGEIAEELEAKYQNEQKTEAIKLLSTEKQLQSLQLAKRENERNVIIAFAVLLLLLAGLLYNQFIIKQRANKKLKELDSLKSNFFANISHEFRTPLTLIKGPIELLEQNPDEQLSIENVKMIRRNTNRVLTLVNQLLDLSRIDQGNLKLQLTEGDINKCLKGAAASFNSHAAQRNIDYRVSISKNVLWTSFDRDKLEKIVYNLLGNAFKFTENESVVSFKVDYQEPDLQLQVSDSGSGIPEDKLPFIFDRFYQVDGGSTRENEGSGIGLSLSKNLIELMDGTITVLSELNKGTFFTVHIPLQKIKTRHIEASKIDIHSPSKQTPFKLSKTDSRTLPAVLLVEDNYDMRHFIKDQLLPYFRIIEAFDGDDGKQKALQFSPNLIITDLMMPEIDGIELCRMLKTNLNTSHIPIIMLTAKAGIENKIEGLDTGADDYLIKPFDVNELLARCKNLINQREKLRELYTNNKETTINPKRITVTSIDQIFLEKVIALLETEFSNPDFGVPQMQDHLAMSKTQLNRKLKALTNEAPGELLRNFRLKRAAQLLSQKADSVTQIAYKVGFNNLSYFAKCFKELYGISPSAY